jgi:hypothetical protein
MPRSPTAPSRCFNHALRIIGDKATLKEVVAGGPECGSKRSQFCTKVALPRRIELLFSP